MEQKLTASNVLRRVDRMCAPDGTVAISPGNRPDAMSTSQVAVLAHDLSTVGSLLQSRRLSMGRFVASLQQPDGHWEREYDDWHMSITAWAVLALKSYALDSGPAAQRGAAWITRNQGPDGGFPQSDLVKTPNTYSTSYATAALYSATGDTAPVGRGLAWLRRAQDKDGGYADDYTVRTGPDPSLTAYVAHALSRLPRSMVAAIIGKCADFIAGSQRPSGAWSAWYEDADSIEGTAAALRVLLDEPGRYGSQIRAGLDYLIMATNLDELENWIVVSLAYVVLGTVPDDVG
jgi:hypothetical protein